MKILLVKSYPKLTSFGHLAKGLKKRGHDVHILVPRRHSDCKKMRDLGINVHIINFLNFRSYFRSSKANKHWINTPTFKKIVKFLKTNSFDVINLKSLSAHRVLGAASCFLKKSVVVSTAQGFEVGYEKLANCFADAIVALSSALKRYLISKGLAGSKIEVIPNGIDIEEMDTIKEDKFYLHKELGLDPKIKLIGMVAYFYNRVIKGHKIFLDAAKIVARKYPDTRFVLVGADFLTRGSKKYFQDYARKLGIKNKVYFLGERDDVPAMMSSLYLHTLPSFSEGCPMVLLEAMARKIPNVASRIEPIKEIVKDGVTGILFKPGNAKLLAKAISLLLENPKLARKMGIAGRKRLEARFNAEYMAEKHDDLYRRIIRKKTATNY